MLRSRVRRSFTVEVKSKSRQAPSWPENPAPSPVNWAALDPAPETPSPFEAAWSGETTASVQPVAAEKPRRILPSLIVPEPEPPEPVVEREPRLPRVRRVKPSPARSEAPQTGASWSLADIYDDDDAAPEPQVAQQRSIPPQPVLAAPISAPSRKAAKPRSAEPALGPGERWKRRLPRSCR